MLKNLLIGLIGLVLVLLVISFFLPRHVHLERSIVIEAPQHTVFTLLNGFARFNEWSPWAGRDPNTIYAYEGPSHGVGASMSWQSEDPDVGTGQQTITASQAPSRIESDLDFGPQGTAQAFFNVEPADSEAEGEAVKVTWGFDSDLGMNPIGRWFGLFLDKFLGPDYEAGLAGLKQLAETLPKADFSTLAPEMSSVEALTIAFINNETSTDPEAVGAALGESYGKIMAFIAQNGLTASGPPLSINHEWGEKYVFDAAIPVTNAPAEGSVSEDSEIQIGSTWNGNALKTIHKGAYARLPQTYEAIEAYLAAHGFEVAGPPWEVWISDPGVTPEEELITEIYFPLG